MLKKIEDMNYYELLEVSPRATAQEIHKAYERIRKIYDPNSIALYSLFSPEETEKIRLRIEDAYRTLIYEENRRAYDQSMHGLLQEPEQPQPRPQSRPPVQAVPSQPLQQRPPRETPAAPAPPVVPPPPAPTVLPLQPPPAEIAEFTGPILKILREQRGMTIRAVADISKLGGRYIEGIEEENFRKLPARPYLRGFLVLYAKTLGYEPDRIVNDYMKRYDTFNNPPKK